ncbi:MFS transporter [uncultured Mailhella sp.]|uniref:MFS transporter n=1 Tax=uncultured Mailhella sp. TaxID=1981031 RepID=UPI0026045688|nr:MFS transporter [uncultured Mailhella sp.]
MEHFASLRLKGIIAALWTGNLLAPLLMSGVAAMLPAIGSSFGASAVELSLVMVCYNLGQTVSHLAAGKMCVIHGTKRFLLFSMGLFVALSLLLASAFAMPAVIGLRLAQGISAGGISCCVTALSFTIAPPEHRGKVISIVLTAVYLGLTLGPLVCGGLTELLNWRLVFALVAALGCVVFVLLRSGLPPDKSASGERFDVPGALLLFLGLSAVTLGAACAFLHPGVIWFFPTGLVLTGLFLRRDWRSPHSILELALLSGVRGVFSGLLATFVNYGAIMGLSLFFSLYLQQVLGLNAFQAGMVMMVQSFAQLLFTLPAGGWTDLFGAARVASLGLAVSAAGLAGVLLLDEHSSLAAVCVCEALLGGGVGVFAASSMAATLEHVPAPQISVASGLLGCMRTLGGLMSNMTLSCTIGFFMGSAVVSPANTGLFLAASRCALILFIAMNLLGLAVMLRTARRR